MPQIIREVHGRHATLTQLPDHGVAALEGLVQSGYGVGHEAFG